MSTPEDAAKFFEAKDVDDNGSLSKAELENALKSNGYSKKQVNAVFSEIDLEPDGQISKEEFLVYMGHCDPAVHAEATKKRFFGQFDKDHDGKVDHDELQQAMSECGIEWSDEETARALELLDKDGSGTINCAELITLLYGDQEADD